jgi:hypothetical protein
MYIAEANLRVEQTPGKLCLKGKAIGGADQAVRFTTLGTSECRKRLNRLSQKKRYQEQFCSFAGKGFYWIQTLPNSMHTDRKTCGFFSR